MTYFKEKEKQDKEIEKQDKEIEKQEKEKEKYYKNLRRKSSVTISNNPINYKQMKN